MQLKKIYSYKNMAAVIDCLPYSYWRCHRLRVLEVVAETEDLAI